VKVNKLRSPSNAKYILKYSFVFNMLCILALMGNHQTYIKYTNTYFIGIYVLHFHRGPQNDPLRPRRVAHWEHGASFQQTVTVLHGLLIYWQWFLYFINDLLRRRKHGRLTDIRSWIKNGRLRRWRPLPWTQSIFCRQKITTGHSVTIRRQKVECACAKGAYCVITWFALPV